MGSLFWLSNDDTALIEYEYFPTHKTSPELEVGIWVRIGEEIVVTHNRFESQTFYVEPKSTITLNPGDNVNFYIDADWNYVTLIYTPSEGLVFALEDGSVVVSSLNEETETVTYYVLDDKVYSNSNKPWHRGDPVTIISWLPAEIVQYTPIWEIKK